MSIHSEPGGRRPRPASADEPEIKRRADAERNLARIIEAATTLLAVNPGASMAEIAEASGLVRATLYRHFPTRDDLMRAMYAAALDDALKAILSVDPEQRQGDRRHRAGGRRAAGGRRPLPHPERGAPALTRSCASKEQSVGAPLIALVERGQRERRAARRHAAALASWQHSGAS